MFSTLIKFLIKHQERATLIGMGVGLIVLIGMGLYLQKSNSSNKRQPPITVQKVELEVKKSESSEDKSAVKKGKSTFYLRPSAQELLEQLANMENLQEEAAQRKFENLRVLWPVYFFSMEPSGSDVKLILDISENGFGAVVTGLVKVEDYPQLNEKLAGDRLWVAGEIIGVEPSGTGTIHLDIGLLDFTTKGPIPPSLEGTAENSTANEKE